MCIVLHTEVNMWSQFLETNCAIVTSVEDWIGTDTKCEMNLDFNSNLSHKGSKYREHQYTEVQHYPFAVGFENLLHPKQIKCKKQENKL